MRIAAGQVRLCARSCRNPLLLYPARGEMRRSGKGGRASVRAGGDRRRLGRSLALPKWLNPDHARYLPRAGRNATVREGRASLRASRRGSEKARTEPRPPKMAQSRPREVSTPRGEKCDGPGREGEPPCEPAGIGEGSDGASPSQNGSIPTTRGIYPARGEMRRSGKGGRASVRAGGDRRRLGRSLALPKWLNPDHARYLPRAGRNATVREGRASLRASRRGSEKARTEPRPGAVKSWS